MSEVKKELCCGNLKFIDMSKLDSCEQTDSCREYCYNSTTYAASYKGIQFNMVKHGGMGVSSVDVMFNSDDFKNKTSLINFYREMKKDIVIID